MRDQFGLTHYTKYDLDAAQCLGMLVYILNHLVMSIIERKKTGLVFSNSAELSSLISSCKEHDLNLMQMYVLKRLMQWKARHVKLWTNGFFSQERPLRSASSDEESAIENTQESSRQSVISLPTEIRLRNEQDAMLKRQYFEKYGFIRASITVDSVRLAITNLKNFIIFDKIYKAADVDSTTGQARREPVEPVARKLIASRVFKHEDSNFYWANLHLHINMNVDFCDCRKFPRPWKPSTHV